MQTTSATWKELWRNPLHEEEIKLEIAGVEYLHDKIVAESLMVSGGMFDTFDIGNCAARQMDVEIYPQGVIPRQAEIKIFKRLVWFERIGATTTPHYSEWIPNGVFFISTRQRNKISDTLTIHGFDAMLKAGAPFLAGPDYGTWPKTETQAATEIAAKMGTTLDPRTHLDNKFLIDYAIDETGEMTMTDILECIAVANCGNWIITDAGQLLLRRLDDLPDETNYLVNEYGIPIQFGKVVLLV